ncbi:MAG: hypothetical protein HC876_05705 [Chloroflexaceae bacterium]|nr:hypothetical protein [Chloroflexaceae bacterium]
MRPLRPFAAIRLGLTLLLVIVLAGITYPIPLAAAPISTAFTYQGQLIRTDMPVNDTCDFEFTLWDAETDGTQLGPTLARTATVTDGYFNVRLNFGTAVFQGDERYLEIAVQCSTDAELVPLAGRVHLTATPYALYALGASWSGLTDVPPDFADGIDNDTTYTAGTGLTLDAANTFALDFGAIGTNFWLLGGNSGIDPVNDVLGTTDTPTFTMVVNNVPALRLTAGPTLPNLIGGDLSNTVAAGVDAGVIGGGAENTLNVSFATIGGGISNTASGSSATLAVALDNTAERRRTPRLAWH